MRLISRMNLLTLFAVIMTAVGLSAQTPDVGYAVAAGDQQKNPIGDVAPIKGAPFCTTVVTEHTQNLSDGNRIHTSESSQLCRDSQGRTRREASLNLLEAAPQASTPMLISIADPVAGFHYLLDSNAKIAQKVPIFGQDKSFFIVSDKAGAPGKGDRMMFVERSGVEKPNFSLDDMKLSKPGDDSTAPNSEDLGDQTIEGIHARGTRVTTVIPAGKMGNEKPITVTSERWYSPELKVDVMTKHDDPWAGELKIEFKNVSTAEPDASLFTVPADYKVIIEDKEGPVVYKLSGPSAAQQ
jgi:hypothetical protein